MTIRTEQRPERQAAPRVEQFPSLWPDAPELLAGVARTLSRDPARALARMEKEHD
jgi:hypothetical protein